jgi:hypothetical protein
LSAARALPCRRRAHEPGERALADPSLADQKGDLQATCGRGRRALLETRHLVEPPGKNSTGTGCPGVNGLRISLGV